MPMGRSFTRSDFTGRQKDCACGQQHAYRLGSIHMISLRVIAFCQHPTAPYLHVNHKACLPNRFMTRILRLPAPHPCKAVRGCGAPRGFSGPVARPPLHCGNTRFHLRPAMAVPPSPHPFPFQKSGKSLLHAFPGALRYGNRLSFPTPCDLLQSAPHG